MMQVAKLKSTVARVPLSQRQVRIVDEGSQSSDHFRPATTLNPNNIWLRQITKLIRHLRDDLARRHPNETMPTTWMIKCLVASMPKPEFNTLDINQFAVSDEKIDRMLMGILQKLIDRTNSAEHIRNAFFELDGITPLFPNQELFGPQHANRFAQLALNYLNQSLSTNRA